MQPTTTRQFLLAVRHKLEEQRGDRVTDYRLSKELGVTHSAVSRYLTKPGATFDDKVAVKVAGILGIHEGYVAACIQAERATLPEARSMWESVANMLRGVAALFVVAASALIVLELELVELSPALLQVASGACVLC